METLPIPLVETPAEQVTEMSAEQVMETPALLSAEKLAEPFRRPFPSNLRQCRRKREHFVSSQLAIRFLYFYLTCWQHRTKLALVDRFAQPLGALLSKMLMQS